MRDVGNGENLPLDFVLRVLFFPPFSIFFSGPLIFLRRSRQKMREITYQLVALLVTVDLRCLVTLFKGRSLLVMLDDLASLIAIQANGP